MVHNFPSFQIGQDARKPEQVLPSVSNHGNAIARRTGNHTL